MKVTCILVKSGLRADGTYISAEEIRKMVSSFPGKDVLNSDRTYSIAKVVAAELIELDDDEVEIEGTIKLKSENSGASVALIGRATDP